jgi:hypothetical protein
MRERFDEGRTRLEQYMQTQREAPSDVAQEDLGS